MTPFIVTAVIVLVVLAVALFVIRKKNRESNIARADDLRTQAATRAQATLPPAQDRAAAAEAKADEARVTAERAQSEADEARVAASKAEAAHEGEVRAADRLDPRVNHKAADYAPQVGGTVDQQPTAPSEVNRAPDQPVADEPVVDQPVVDQPVADEPMVDPHVAEPAVAEPAADTPAEDTPADGTPLLPRRTPGANDMPGKPIETDGTSGGWFTRTDT